MGINFRKRVLLSETHVKRCKKCNKIFSEDSNFCRFCGEELVSEKTKVYANFGKNGITSYSYKLANGTTINSKGNITVPIGNGISYSSKC